MRININRMNLTDKLTIEDRNAITEPLLGITWVKGTHPNGCEYEEAYDENGDLASDYDTDLRTLGGIIAYACTIARDSERRYLQANLRKIIGL